MLTERFAQSNEPHIRWPGLNVSTAKQPGGTFHAPCKPADPIRVNDQFFLLHALFEDYAGRDIDH